MKQDIQSHSSDQDKKVLDSIKLNRIIVPILLGILVVFWLMSKQLDLDEFAKIEWNTSAMFWLLMALLCYVARHFFYAWRLRVLSSEEFSWPKSIELIVIWEFASSVSPTSIGGSAVALFLLAQEKISAAKTVSIVLYSMVLDTLFFIISLPILYFILGAIIIRPGMESLSDLDGFGYTFIAVVLFMTFYGALFFYGLFIKPVFLKRFLLWISKIRFLKRFKKDLRKTAMDVVITSNEIGRQPLSFHILSMLLTTGAWTLRFLAISCIILALVATTPTDLWTQLLIYARGETMYAVTAFSPTPGGAGITEYLFGGFFSDYIPKGIAAVVALVWRLITYYPYLILGAIVIPIWIRGLVNRSRQG